MQTDSTVLGTVEGVTGSTLSIALHSSTSPGLTFVRGHGYRIGQIGSFVRIPMGYTDLFGVVTSVGAAAVPENLARAEPFGHRWLTVQLIGEGSRKGQFRRGVSQFPTVGDPVHLVTDDDLGRIYGRPSDGRYLPIGTVASAESIPALLDVNMLLTRHSAVVGATGSGKSTTVAALLDVLSDQRRYPSARVLVLDIHGEYARALRGKAAVFRVGADASRGESPLLIPYWALTFDELLELTFGHLEDTERGAVRQKIDDMKRETLNRYPRPGVTDDTLTVDTPVPFSLHHTWFDLHKLVYATHTVGGGQTDATAAYEPDATGKPLEIGDPIRVVAPRYRPHTQAAGSAKIYLAQTAPNIRRQVDTLASRLRDRRYDFLFRPGYWMPDATGATEKDLDALLEAWIGGPTPVTVLDLSGIPSTVLTTLVGALLRILYDSLFWARDVSEGARARPLLLVLEEAHAYLSGPSGGRATMAVQRIVKEGRKYGIGAMIVSQRPSELDMTILSQCGTLFAMRLNNPVDRTHVTGSVTDNLAGLLAILPVLRTGEAIVVGEAVHLPMRALIQAPPADRRPDSADPRVYTADDEPGGWNSVRTPQDYAEVIRLWRSQEHRSTRVIAPAHTEEDSDSVAGGKA